MMLTAFLPICNEKKKYVCFVIIWIMAISGMCFAGVEADSIVVYSPEGIITSEFFVSPGFFRDMQNHTEESSGMSAAPVLSTELESTREDYMIKGELLFLSLADLPDLFQNVSKIQNLLTDLLVGSGNTIIRYIHHQDGMNGEAASDKLVCETGRSLLMKKKYIKF